MLQGFVESFEVLSDVVPLSVVGDRFSQDGQALYEVVALLGQSKIDVVLGTSSALAVTLGVSIGQVDDAVRVLHAQLVLK